MKTIDLKKILSLLVFVLFPFLLLSQTQTENYIKNSVYLTYSSGVSYSNYSQSLALSDFIYTSSGGGSGSININNNVLTVSFSGSWSSQPMKTGTIKTLTVTPTLPTIELGPILTSGIQTGYFAKIENNNLIFYSPIFLTGINTTLTTSIAGIPSINYSVSTGNPYTCPTGGGGGGGGTISVTNGIAQLSVSGGWSATCSLKTGNIVYLSTSAIPNTELGIIKDSNGLDTNYRAKIENNWLVYYPIQTVPAFPSAGSLNFTLNLGSQQTKQESITYFDGLGRPVQSIGIGAGGQNQDIITHIAYDAFGRQDKEYLPYATTTNGGAYRIDALSATNSFYNTTKYENTTNPYSQKLFEASPLNRILEQTAPGASWVAGTTFDANGHSNGNTVKLGHNTNITSEVKLYSVSLTFGSNTYTPTLQNLTPYYYAANELYKTITKDENWKTTDGLNKTTEEFKDKQGRVVLKRTYNANAPHDTYYVYDDYGNLTYVLPPKMEASTATLATVNSQLNELGYQYKYDHRNRLVEKKIPGKEWEYIVYNKLDQPILTQDANLKAQNKWLFTKYDVFGRVAYTGIISGGTRITLQTAADATISQFVTKSSSSTVIAGTTIYYNNGAYPILAVTDEIQTINYYDNYTFDKDVLTIPATAEGQAIVNYNNLNQGLTKGLPTGSKVRVLGTSNWITTITGYDAKARPIYAASRNTYLLTTDVVTSLLDFVGKVDKTTTTHTKTGNNTITTVDLFTYDHIGRLLKQTQAINGAATPEVIAQNTYDELGQLIGKGVGGKTSRLQTVDYTYNIRGWLKQINNPVSLGTDLFGFKINYNIASHGATTLFNGNIAETEWKTQNDNVLRWYNYSYDALNRITKGISSDGKFDLGATTNPVTYDKNGNILSLYRKGAIVANPVIGTSSNYGIMDNLTYTYQANSNKLVKVSDSGNSTYGFKDGTNTTTEYTYDTNGNMLKDLNKAMTSNILYNHLNLPTKVTFATGNISYIYDATGVKLEKVLTQGTNITRTKYAGNYIYENDVLQFFNQPEGYVEPDGSGGFDYVYQYKDHLGNIRLSYKDNNGTLEIVEENNYYPFGLKHKGYNANINGTHHKYMFGGKEFDESFQTLNTYDFGARNYDPALGRWMTLDPLAEVQYQYSLYSYTFNSPIMFNDPTGMIGQSPIYGTNGAFLGTDDEGLQGKAIVMDKKDFKQGMSHDKALTKSKGTEGLNSKEAGSKLLNHYDGLKVRPDYDGEMSYNDLVNWGKENGNSPVYLDASKIDLGGISTNDFPGVGNGARINTVGKGTPLNTYGPWGKNYMTLLSSQGEVSLSPDEFDYRQHNLGDAWKEGIKVFMYESLVRYPSIKALQTFHGVDDNFGFMMYPYGKAQLKSPKVGDTVNRFGE